MGAPDMHLREVAAILKDATRLVTLAKEKLDTRKKKCGDCGLEKYVDWEQGKVADELGGVLTKLRRFHNKWALAELAETEEK